MPVARIRSWGVKLEEAQRPVKEYLRQLLPPSIRVIVSELAERLWHATAAGWQKCADLLTAKTGFAPDAQLKPGPMLPIS